MDQLNQEKVFYQDGIVFVSNSRLVVKGTTFALPNIVSVSIEQDNSNNINNISLGILGLFLVGLGTGRIISYWYLLLIAGIVVIILAGYLFWKNRKQYLLKIFTNGSNFETQLSDNESYANSIVEHINRALVFRN